MLLFCFLSAIRSGLHRSCKEYLLQCLILHIILYKWQCPHPNPSHCEGFSNVPFLSARSRILVVEFAKAETQAFRVLSARSFRPLAAKPRTVIAYERFCSHPVKLNSKRQKRRPLPVVSARLVPSPLRYSGPVIRF